MNTGKGRTTPEERAGERLLNRLGAAAREKDFASLPSVEREMSPAEEDALAEMLTARVGEARAQTHELGAEAKRSRGWRRTWGIGSSLAIAASFALSWIAREDPTKYRLEATASDLEYRGAHEESSTLPLHHTGSRIAFVLRPSQRPRRLGVPRLAELRDGVATELRGRWDSAASGAFRLEARVGELLPDRVGEVTLAFTVAPSAETSVRWPASDEAPSTDISIYRFKIRRE